MKHQLPTIEEFQAYWKSQSKDSVIDQLWEMFLHCQNLEDKIAVVQEQNFQRNADYLSRCRSSGGVTLPPGV